MTGGDERLREEQTSPDERLREEQTSPDERLREEQMGEMTGPALTTRAALIRVVIALALAGALVGVVWGFLVPSVQGVVALTSGGDRVRGYVGDESDQLFLGAFLMVGMLSVLAVVSGVWVWKLRPYRGPAMVGALTLGAVLAAGAATGVGALLARWRYGVLDVAGAPVSPEHRVHYVTEAPGVFFGHTWLQIAATIVFPAGIAALVYAIGALSTARDDLGAWPPSDPGLTTRDPVTTAAFVPPADPSAPLR